MKKQIAELAANVSKLQRFSLDCPMDFPEDKVVIISIDGSIPTINFFCHDYDREEVLGIIGQALSPIGWIAHPEYGNKVYSWRKEIDGIKLVIHDAEAIPQPIERPVSPKAFPLLLK